MELTQTVIIGYGSQAKAWCQNLRDSGLPPKVLLRDESPNLVEASNQGFETLQFSDDLSKLQGPFIILTPDHTHYEILEKLSSELDLINPVFIYAHGYSYLNNSLEEKYPHFTHLLLAPKAIATEVRSRYLKREKLIAVLADPKGHSKPLLEELSRKLGITKTIEAGFQDEAYADLFSEQSLLCSLLPYGAKKSFDLLVEKGINPEVAFTECWMEVKLIADAMLDVGPEGFFKLISPNALIGGEKARSLIFDNEYQKKLDSLWQDISTGRFYDEVDNSDISKLRKEVLDEWSTSRLNQIYKNFYEGSDEKGTDH